MHWHTSRGPSSKRRRHPWPAYRPPSGADICSQNRLRTLLLHSAHVTPLLYYLLTPTSFRCYFIPLCNCIYGGSWCPRSLLPTPDWQACEKLFVHRMNACQPNVNAVVKYLVYYLARGLAYKIRIVDRRNIKYNFKTLSIFSEIFKSTWWLK